MMKMLISGVGTIFDTDARGYNCPVGYNLSPLKKVKYGKKCKFNLNKQINKH